MFDVLLTLHGILPNLLQPYKRRSIKSLNSFTLLPAAKTSGQPKRSTTDVAAAAAAAAAKRRRKRNTHLWKQQLTDASSTYSNICTYWAANPAFDPKRILLKRLFFINGDKTKYVTFGFYPACDYQLLVEFGAIRRCGSKSNILTDQKVHTLAECIPKIHESMCEREEEEEKSVIKCGSGSFRI